jgi:hypothetical protein
MFVEALSLAYEKSFGIKFRLQKKHSLKCRHTKGRQAMCYTAVHFRLLSFLN